MAIQSKEATHQAKSVALVIPCYNERHRLNVTAFSYWLERDVHLVFVDDGSSDGTFEFLQLSFAGCALVEVLRNERNLGKAESVRHGMLHALKSVEGAEWIGFWDADLSAPPDQLSVMLEYADCSASSSAAAIWGSRLKRLGADIQRSTARHMLGRAFAFVVNLVFRASAYDTQCGAKLFRRNVIPVAFQERFSTDWIFDVELCLRLRSYLVVECPLTKWREDGCSRIRFCRLLSRLPFQFLEVRNRYRHVKGVS